MNDARMPFTQHLEELRRRLFIALAGVGVGFLVCYYFADRLLTFLQKPLSEKLIFLAPTEAFFVHLKVALYAGIFLSLPLTLYEIWMFVVPGLLEREKRYVLPFVIGSAAAFGVGGAFAYLLVLPYGLVFLLSFGTESIVPQIALGYYISFSFTLVFAFGLVFELPLVTVLLVQLGVITPEFLRRRRRYVIVLAFVLAALLTPPDVFTQTMLAGPLIVLYELSVLVARLMERGKRKEAEAEEAKSAGPV